MPLPLLFPLGLPSPLPLLSPWACLCPFCSPWGWVRRSSAASLSLAFPRFLQLSPRFPSLFTLILPSSLFTLPSKNPLSIFLSKKKAVTLHTL